MLKDIHNEIVNTRKMIIAERDNLKQQVYWLGKYIKLNLPDKTKIQLVIAPAVVSLFCIVLAVNAAISKSQLNAERAKTTSLNRQVVDLEVRYKQAAGFEAQISDVKSNYDGLIKNLQYSLDTARREADIARREADALRATNSDLERRLNVALNASSQAPSATAVPEASALAAE